MEEKHEQEAERKRKGATWTLREKAKLIKRRRIQDVGYWAYKESEENNWSVWRAWADGEAAQGRDYISYLEHSVMDGDAKDSLLGYWG